MTHPTGADHLGPQGALLEEWRAETGLSLNRLAEAAGLSRETLSRIKHGGGMRDDTADKLSKALTKILGRPVTPGNVQLPRDAEAAARHGLYRRLRLLEERQEMNRRWIEELAAVSLPGLLPAIQASRSAPTDQAAEA